MSKVSDSYTGYPYDNDNDNDNDDINLMDSVSNIGIKNKINNSNTHSINSNINNLNSNNTLTSLEITDKDTWHVLNSNDNSTSQYAQSELLEMYMNDEIHEDAIVWNSQIAKNNEWQTFSETKLGKYLYEYKLLANQNASLLKQLSTANNGEKDGATIVSFKPHKNTTYKPPDIPNVNQLQSKSNKSHIMYKRHKKKQYKQSNKLNKNGNRKRANTKHSVKQHNRRHASKPSKIVKGKSDGKLYDTINKMRYHDNNKYKL